MISPASSGQGARQLLSLQTTVHGREFTEPNAPQGAPTRELPVRLVSRSRNSECLFDVRPTLPSPLLTAAQHSLSQDRVRYWTQFARLANPNSLLTPPWVRYFPVLLDCIQKLSLLQPYNGFNADHKCDLWTALANASTGS